MARKKNGLDITGILLLDKPIGLSSNQALQKVKRLLNANKAGHTGSLDPLATGVLPICFGKSTKISQYLLNSDKSYEATIKYGSSTDTGDSEGSITYEDTSFISPTIDELEHHFNKLRGVIYQTPPMYSALKYHGQPLYKLAREGIEIDRPKRCINIYNLTIIEYRPENNEIDISVKCSKGTYIRSLAISLGDFLGCGAHITRLKRTECGILKLENCYNLETIENTDISERIRYVIHTENAFTDTAIYNIPTIEAEKQFYNSGKLPENSLHGVVRIHAVNEECIGIASMEHGKLISKQIFTTGI